MSDRTDKEWQGKLKKLLSEMKCPKTVQEALEGLDMLDIDLNKALEKVERKREEWTKNEKLSEMELGEAGL